MYFVWYVFKGLKFFGTAGLPRDVISRVCGGTIKLKNIFDGSQKITKDTDINMKYDNNF